MKQCSQHWMSPQMLRTNVRVREAAEAGAWTMHSFNGKLTANSLFLTKSSPRRTGKYSLFNGCRVEMRPTVTEDLVRGPTTAGSLISTARKSWRKTQLLVEQAPWRINMCIAFQ